MVYDLFKNLIFKRNYSKIFIGKHVIENFEDFTVPKKKLPRIVLLYFLINITFFSY